MTANVTPRLKLMSPLDSDDFESADFVDTMTKLDNAPGTRLVANYAALQTVAGTLTQAQNGLKYAQLDNQAEWMWVQPTSSAGSFKRTNSLGVMGYDNVTSQIATTSTTGTTIFTVPTFKVPGGRMVQVTLDLQGCESTNGLFAIDIFYNSTLWLTRTFAQPKTNPFAYNISYHASLIFSNTVSAMAGQNISWTAKAKALTLAASSGGGGTVDIGSGSYMWVTEL